MIKSLKSPLTPKGGIKNVFTVVLLQINCVFTVVLLQNYYLYNVPFYYAGVLESLLNK